MQGTHPDVAVIGAGLIGLTCARALVARGLTVCVLDSGAPSRQASWASAGMIAPLAEVPQPGPFFEICRRARDLWTSYAPALAAESGFDLDYDTSGALALAEGSDRLLALEAAAKTVQEPCRRLEPAAAATLLPGLAAVEEVLLLPGEHRIDNRALGLALIDLLGRQGVQIRSDWPVVSVRTRPGGVELQNAAGERLEAGAAVLAAGAWSGQIAGLPSLPVLPVHGQMLALGNVDWPWQGSVRGSHFYAVRRQGGRLLVGATAEEIGFSGENTLGGLADLSDWSRRLFPGLAGCPLLELWSGLRPATPDRLPILGELERGVFVATAHFRNGILLAPWTAEKIAELVAGIPIAAPDRPALALFSPDRFPRARH